MGSPSYLNREQIETLKKSSELKEAPIGWKVVENGIVIETVIQSHSAAVISLTLHN